MIHRRTVFALAAVLLLSPSPALAQPTSVLRIGSSQDIQIIDPMFTTAHATRDHGYLVYDTLFAVDSQLRVQPQMVDQWEVSADGLNYTFRLRPGLLFHDGAPVTSRDAVASIRRWANADPTARLMMRVLASIEPVADDTFRIVLREPFPPLIENMAKPSGAVLFVLPERIAQTPHTAQLRDPTGSGPFVFQRDQWVPGQRRVYTRFDGYRPRAEPQDNTAGAKIAGVARIEYIIMPDDATRQAALIRNEVDYVANLQPDLLEELKRHPEIVSRVRDVRGEQGWIRFNHLIPPFNDARLRQVVYHGINQEEHLATVIRDPALRQVCYAMFGCGTPYETEAGAEAIRRNDIEMGRRLLREAGYDGTPVVMLQPSNHAQNSAWTLRTAESLRRLGFTVEVQPMALATFMQRRTIRRPSTDGGWNLFVTTFATVDVLNPLVNPAVNTSCAGDNWPGWPCNEEIEAMRLAFLNAPDAEARKATAERIQAAAYEHGTHIVFGVFKKVDSWRSSLQGVQDASVGILYGISKN
ncbi:ABC transporter substrate-binding protein [Elioraea sp.]|uniref:ABC transporter substrate-binding protein n=1 Tax=Elioraea sp. TaxID=2185103 RepID=UPI003F6FEE84